MILEQDTQRLLDGRGIQFCSVQRNQSRNPVEGFRDPRYLVKFRRTQLLNEGGHLTCQSRGGMRHLRHDDAQLFVEIRIVDPEVETAALERVVQLACSVGCDDDDGWRCGANSPKLRDRDLKIGQKLEQESFELIIGPVQLINQEDWGTTPRVRQRTE